MDESKALGETECNSTLCFGGYVRVRVHNKDFLWHDLVTAALTWYLPGDVINEILCKTSKVSDKIIRTAQTGSWIFLTIVSCFLKLCQGKPIKLTSPLTDFLMFQLVMQYLVWLLRRSWLKNLDQMLLTDQFSFMLFAANWCTANIPRRKAMWL